MNKDRLIVSCGVRGWYPKGLSRMKTTLSEYEGFSIQMWSNEFPPGSPTHKQNPYAFKAWSLKWAKDNGYKNVLWLDAAVWANKDPSPIFEEIEKNGYLLLENGWNQGNWSSQKQLDYYGKTREEAFKMPHPMACIFGVSFNHDIGNEVFERYFKAANDGIFIGPWKNLNGKLSNDKRVLGTRHDQTCLGFIANELNLEFKSGIVAYVKPNTDGKESIGGEKNIENYIFHSQGGGKWPPA
jgi:hypothetical protein